MIDRAILSVSVVVLLVVMALALFLMALPLFQQIEFEALCHGWMRRMDAGGGLTMLQQAQFADQLTQRGYFVRLLSATDIAAFGQNLTLTVRVSKLERRIAPDLTMKEEVVSRTFTRTVICRKIVTGAGDP